MLCVDAKIQHLYEDLAELLTLFHFRIVDFAEVMHHIPEFQEMTLDYHERP
mgnify:CR=1 FL=1